MKSFAAVLLAATAAASATQPSPQRADLRSVLTSAQRAPVPPAVRALSAEQRAELRRQIQEAQRARRRP